MSQLLKIVEQLMNIIAIAFAVGLFIYEAQQFDTESGSSYISIGGALSLLIILGYLIFTQFKIWLNNQLSGSIGYLSLVMTYGFFFVVYSFVSFSIKLYKEYRSSDLNQESLILNGLGALGGLVTVILLSPYAGFSIYMTLLFLFFQPHIIYKYLTKKIKKIR